MWNSVGLPVKAGPNGELAVLLQGSGRGDHVWFGWTRSSCKEVWENERDFTPFIMGASDVIMIANRAYEKHSALYSNLIHKHQSCGKPAEKW